jgi:ParB-like chromosome segregation protein Spo0J
MGKKEVVNSKKQAGHDRKEAQKQKKDNEKKAKEEELLAEEWSKGAKGNKKQAEVDKKEEQLRKKQERDLILKMEEQELGDKRPLQRQPKQHNTFKINIQEEYVASGVDQALELLGAGDSKLDRHPERRVKSAYLAFEQRMMPILKQDNPSLRLSQLNQLLQKEWKKSPDNPLNQETISYNATQEEYQEKLEEVKARKQEKYRLS